MREGEAKRTYELYGVLEQALVKVTFTHDFYNNLMSNQAKYKNFLVLNEQYQGSLIRAIVSSNELVISCADCAESAVKFYDHDLKKLYQLDMPFSQAHAYELAYHEQRSLEALQLFIADGQTIQTILKATDTDGKSSFREEETP